MQRKIYIIFGIPPLNFYLITIKLIETRRLLVRVANFLWFSCFEWNSSGHCALRNTRFYLLFRGEYSRHNQEKASLRKGECMQKNAAHTGAIWLIPPIPRLVNFVGFGYFVFDLLATELTWNLSMHSLYKQNNSAKAKAKAYNHLPSREDQQQQLLSARDARQIHGKADRMISRFQRGKTTALCNRPSHDNCVSLRPSGSDCFPLF